LAGLSDGQLLERFITRCDNVAFEELIARHGPVVLGICRRWLDDPRDIEDAFQATFLILVRKAASLRDRDALSSWLYGVALRVVRRARANAVRRRVRERPISGEPAGRGRTPQECTGDDVLAIVDEEIRRLPEKQQVVVILCLLEGYTHEAAASELSWPLGTVKSRIAAARQTLTRRLTRRGLAPSGVVAILRPGLGLGEPLNSISPHIVRLTVETARESLSNPWIPTAGTSATIAGLVRDVLRIMLVTRIQSAALVVLALGTLAWAAPALLSARPADRSAHTESRPKAAPIAAAPPSRPPTTDRYGDPLPPGAAMRLGTVRFRQFPWIDHVVYSPNGQLVVTDSLEDYLQVWDARDGKKLRRIGAGMEQIRDFAFSPDGTLIGALGYQSVPQRLNGVAQLTFVDLATGRLVRRAEWDFQESERRLAFAPDGNTVATETDDGTLRLWDVATAKLLHQGRLGGRPNFASIAFSPDAASHLLAIASDRAIHLWNTSNLRDARTFAIEGEHPPTGLAFSPDGMTLAAGIKTVGAEVLLWKVGDGSLLRRFKSRKSTSVCQILFSPDGKLLAAVGFPGPLVLFDARSGEELDAHVKEFDLVRGAFAYDNPMAFSPDGRTLATLGGPQALHFWDLATGKDRLATPEAHLGGVHALTFPPDGKTLISGSDDWTVRIWDLATGRPTKTLSHNGPVWSLAVSADGAFLAAGLNSPKEVHLWNLKTSERLHTWPVASEPLRGVTLSGDGSSVIVALADGSFRCWDLSTGKERAIAQPNLEEPLDAAVAAALPPVTHTARLAAFSRDGRSKAIVRTIPGRAIKLASGEIRHDRSSAGSMIVWLDSQTGHVRREIEIPQSDVQRLAFSPDGQSIAVGYFSTLYPPARGFIRIVRLRDKRGIRTIESPCAWIDSLCFTPDSKQIVAGLQDTSIVIWDVRPTD